MIATTRQVNLPMPLNAADQAWEDGMRRDMDFVRSIMLQISEAPRPITMDDLLEPGASDDDEAKLVQHLKMLIEQAGLVSAVDEHTLRRLSWIEIDLTWAGHEFLDNIRDPEIWKQTKAGAAKIGGFSLKVVASIAEGLLKARVNQLLGGGLDL